jgi:hypothetical protein
LKYSRSLPVTAERGPAVRNVCVRTGCECTPRRVEPPSMLKMVNSKALFTAFGITGA